jgi:predicted TIM-barrel fold metal-dependent hydrolase
MEAFMKIDIYTHVFTPRYKKGIEKYSNILTTEVKHYEKYTTLADHDWRIRILEQYGDMGQVLSITIPPVEEIVGPDEAAELARISNDEMAALLVKYPQKYIAAIANLPLNNIDASLKEAERAIKEPRFKGIQIYTSVQGKPNMA